MNNYNLEKWLNFKLLARAKPNDLSVGWGEICPEQANSITEILDITKAKTVLEIGFNRGASALSWLLNDIDFLYSIDIEGSMDVVNFIKENFEKNRFNFKRIDSKLLTYQDLNMNFDMVFIDGDHSFLGAQNDIQKAMLFSPKYILFDDYCHPYHGVDIKGAIDLFNGRFNKLKFIKQYESIHNPGFGLYEIV